ncbi:hypothetical protein WT08_27310 [Burkholderia sp. MSMB1552]|nr:hypothetical protein WT08_27310 [Burkholderia sp. MSMB1552]KWZ57265.1 hypothetical protein WS92_16050 [Burkholderia sp. MSMB1588]
MAGPRAPAGRRGAAAALSPVLCAGPSREVDATASAMRPLMLDFPLIFGFEHHISTTIGAGSPRHN